MPVHARAFAKVNLVLAVGPRRADGYHELLSLMQSIDLSDTLELAPGSPDAPPVRLSCTPPVVPGDRRNLVYRAATAFQEEFGLRAPVDLALAKGIPLAAGLAGGSADAAATLLGMAALYRLEPDPKRLSALGARLGADVPFCLVGGTARVEGVGERVTPLSVSPGLWLTLWKPPAGVSTAEVYAGLDERRAILGERSARGEQPGGQAWPGRDSAESRLAAAATALAAGDVQALGAVLANDLAPVTEALRPEIREARERFLAAGAAGALMSGSGPTVFALARSEREAEALAGAVQDLPGEVHVTRTVAQGVRLARA